MITSAVTSENTASTIVMADIPYKVWKCVLCGFSYDEAAGMPSDGIPPGTRWADVPDSWTCPDCSAAKSDFEMGEICDACTPRRRMCSSTLTRKRSSGRIF
jgi:rubredoxin